MRNTIILDPWVEGYMDFLKDVRRISVKTIVDKRCTLSRVTRYVEKNHPGETLWSLTHRDYLQWVSHERDNNRTTRTISKDISHLKGLLDYSWRSGRSQRNVLDGFSLNISKELNTPPRVLELEEAKALVNSCRNKTREQRKDRIIILLLYGCGLRTEELCNLNIKSIDLDRQEIMVNGKGDKERIVPVPGSVWSELLAYVCEQRRSGGPLFRTEQKRRRISSNIVCEKVRVAVVMSGITGEVTPRTLRHTFATHLMDQGVDLGVISTLMGHRSPRETGVYLHTLAGKHEAAVEQLNSWDKE